MASITSVGHLIKDVAEEVNNKISSIVDNIIMKEHLSFLMQVFFSSIVYLWACWMLILHKDNYFIIITIAILFGYDSFHMYYTQKYSKLCRRIIKKWNDQLKSMIDTLEKIKEEMYDLRNFRRRHYKSLQKKKQKS